MITLYILYFAVISYMAFFSIQQMKKSYKFVLMTTFAIIIWTLLILLFSGYSASDSYTTEFVMLFALFNFYVWAISFYYSPDDDPRYDDSSNSNNTHEEIMTQFYETELGDISKAKKENEEEAELKKRQTPAAKRRDLKKDPEEKKKEKIWENIMKAAEDDDESSDEDEDEAMP